MKRFWGFVLKEFWHISRDYRTLLVLFGMPLAQILLFGFAVTNEIRQAGFAVLDHSRDEATREITDRMLASGYFRLESTLSHPDQIEPLFRTNRIKEVIVFEAGFQEKLQREGTAQVQVIFDASDPNTGNTLANYTQGIIQSWQMAQVPAGMTPPQIHTQVQMRYNPQLKGVFLFVPGLITIILMLVSAMMTSISIAREKENGSMEVLLVSPMSPFQVVLSKVMPYILLAMMDAVAILALGNLVFGVPMRGNLILLLLEMTLFVVTSLSLGILISTIAPTQQVALLVSLAGLMLPSIMLSGFLFPIENMPIPLQVISHAIPARWFIVIVKNIMLKGLAWEFIWKETFILAGFAVLFLVAAMRNFKIRLE